MKSWIEFLYFYYLKRESVIEMSKYLFLCLGHVFMRLFLFSFGLILTLKKPIKTRLLKRLTMRVMLFVSFSNPGRRPSSHSRRRPSFHSRRCSREILRLFLQQKVIVQVKFRLILQLERLVMYIFSILNHSRKRVIV